MRYLRLVTGAAGVALAAVFATAWAAEGRHGSCASCTGPGLEPRCKATWDEAKARQPEYSMKCEYACARARDPWHAPEPECRCRPPCGSVYVKKRLYKTEQEKVERVPRYEVETVPVGACGCGSCAAGRRSAWDPLGLVSLFRHH